MLTNLAGLLYCSYMRNPTDTMTVTRPMVRINQAITETVTVTAAPEGVPAYEVTYTAPGEIVSEDQWVHVSIFADDEPMTVGRDRDGNWDVQVGRFGQIHAPYGPFRGVMVTHMGETHRQYQDRMGYTRVEVGV